MTIAALAPFRSEPAPRHVDDDFSRLYRQYRPQLLRYVTHHFGARDADEITQESLTRALRSLERDRTDAETWAWLVRVARNVAHDLARSRRLCETTDDAGMLANDVPEDTILPEPAALLNEKRRLVRRALKTLPPSQRRILVLYEVDELNCPAIARLVGSTEYAVRKTLQRARSRFAAEVRALGGGTAGSVVFWLRGLSRRSAKTAAPATASTALCAIVGSVALTVVVQPAQPRELSPRLASPVAASAPELGLGLAGAPRRGVAGTVSSGTATDMADGHVVTSVPEASGPEDITLLTMPKHDLGPDGEGVYKKITVWTPTGDPVVVEVPVEGGDGEEGILCGAPGIDCKERVVRVGR